MGALNRLEQRLEHMVTGAFARAFRSAVQPMEIAAALQREVDNSAQILSRQRRLAPNNFDIDLSASDFDRLATFGEALSRELASMLHDHADEQGYVFAGPVRLNFSRVDALSTGRFRVRSTASAAVTPKSKREVSDGAAAQAPTYLEVNGTRHPLEPPGVVVGRGSEADLRVDDPGVSRRHAEFRVRSGPHGLEVSLLDLGSTNGTLVDGRRVKQAALRDGSTVQIGATRIRVLLPKPGRPPSGGPAGQNQRPAPSAPHPGAAPPAPPPPQYRQQQWRG